MARVNFYATPSGAGAADGSSFANAWTLAQALADATTNKIVNLAGDFTQTATASMAAGTSNWIGWKADQSAPSTSWADMPSIDLAGQGSGNGWNLDNIISISFLEFKNSPGVMLSDPTGGNYQMIAFCKFTDCNQAFGLNDNTKIAFCKFDGMAARSFGDLTFAILGCEFVNTTHTHHYQGFGPGQLLMLNYFDDSASVESVEINGASDFFPVFILNTFNGGAGGIDINPAASYLFFNIFSNITTALDLAQEGHLLLFNDFFNNTTDITETGLASVEIGGLTVDPSYTAIGSDDYTIGEASLIDVAMGGVLRQEVNIGAAQNSGGGGGGGGGYRPRIRKGA